MATDGPGLLALLTEHDAYLRQRCSLPPNEARLAVRALFTNEHGFAPGALAEARAFQYSVQAAQVHRWDLNAARLLCDPDATLEPSDAARQLAATGAKARVVDDALDQFSATLKQALGQELAKCPRCHHRTLEVLTEQRSRGDEGPTGLQKCLFPGCNYFRNLGR